MKSFRFVVMFAVALCAMWLLAAKLQAASLEFEANLDGLQENPPNASPGYGLADLLLDDATGVVTFNGGGSGTYSGILGVLWL